MKEKPKKINQNVITFESGDDNRALTLAKLGMSNALIKSKTGLSDGQITYRLSKAKRVEENTFGYRIAFRNGESSIARRIIDDLSAVAQAEIRRNVVARINHPTPSVVKI